MRSTYRGGTESLRQYALIVLRKMAFIAIGWIAIYFISQPFRSGNFNVLMLFAPMLGALAGLVSGWYMATNALEDSSMGGLPLFVILVLAAVAPMWFMEWFLHLFFRTWELGFGGYMLLAAANLLALASAVWHAASQE